MPDGFTLLERPSSEFPCSRSSESHVVSHGYAVSGQGDGNWFDEPTAPWAWFPALEPAFAYGRALRMSTLVSGWHICAAAIEVKWDPGQGQDVRTMYIDPHSNPRQQGGDELLRAFADGVVHDSAHWPRGGLVRHR